MHVCKAGVTHFHVRQCSEKRMGGGGGEISKPRNVQGSNNFLSSSADFLAVQVKLTIFRQRSRQVIL